MIKYLRLILMLASIYASNAHAITVSFYQGGFEEGAYVSGSFSGGIDTNGFVAHNTLTDFELQFSGNSLFPAFKITSVSEYLAHAQGGMNYYPENGFTAINYGDGMVGVNLSVRTNYDLLGAAVCGLEVRPGISGACGYINNDSATIHTSTFESLVVSTSAVPLPPTIWLLGSSLIGLIGIAKR